MARLSGRPLLDTRADAALFTDREDELARLQRAAAEGLNVLVVGARGSGKTSLLRRYVHDRRGSGEGNGPVLFVDAATIGSAADLLWRVAELLEPERAPAPGGDRSARAALARIAATNLPGQPLVVVDGLPVEVAHPVFGQLRDELWQLPLTWMVSAADRDEPAFRRPPADAFFDMVLRVPKLSPEAMSDLLRRRATPEELDTAAVASVTELAGGNPRRALDLARHLLMHPEAADDLRRGELQRAEALEQLGPSAAMLLAELEASGPASASDAGLLARMGWTRARAAQVLGQLEEAGLVEATSERHGPGRPRRIYRSTGRMSG